MANKEAVKVAETVHGGPSFQRRYPEAASQTFKRGEAVYLNGSGHVAEYTSAIDDGSQRFLGFAADDASNDSVAATREVGVYLADAGNIFEANVTSNGSDQVTALTQVGASPYPLYEDATNSIVMVDIAGTGGQGAWCRILDISDKAKVGETNGRVLFTIVPAARQVLGT